MRLPRFTTRRLMVIIAVVGLDLAFLTSSPEESRRSSCGNSIAGAMTLNVLGGGIALVIFAKRCVGGVR
jgi:hypothetical protein